MEHTELTSTPIDDSGGGGVYFHLQPNKQGTPREQSRTEGARRYGNNPPSQHPSSKTHPGLRPRLPPHPTYQPKQGPASSHRFGRTASRVRTPPTTTRWSSWSPWRRRLRGIPQRERGEAGISRAWSTPWPRKGGRCTHGRAWTPDARRRWLGPLGFRQPTRLGLRFGFAFWKSTNIGKGTTAKLERATLNWTQIPKFKSMFVSLPSIITKKNATNFFFISWDKFLAEIIFFLPFSFIFIVFHLHEHILKKNDVKKYKKKIKND